MKAVCEHTETLSSDKGISVGDLRTFLAGLPKHVRITKGVPTHHNLERIYDITVQWAEEIEHDDEEHDD